VASHKATGPNEIRDHNFKALVQLVLRKEPDVPECPCSSIW
jgi:hypothetical protein